MAETITWGTSNSLAQFYGRTGDSERMAMPFTPSANATSAVVTFYTAYYDTAYLDDIVVSIQGSSSNNPDGTDIGSVTIAGNTVPTVGYPTFSDVLTPTITANLTSGTQYFVVWKKTPLRAPNNIPTLMGDTGGSGCRTYYSGAWYNGSPFTVMSITGSIELSGASVNSGFFALM